MALSFQIRERILEFVRRQLDGVSSVTGQIYFAGSTETASLHADDGTSPSGKALVFGTSIRRFESYRPSQFKAPM